MRTRPWLPVYLAAALVVVSSSPARAQFHEDVGTRAQGMSGAFVAVADDASAVWWNPAGIATGALFSALFEKGRVTQPEQPVFPAPARRGTASGFAVTVPSLGFSYYRIRVSEIATAGSTEPAVQNRQNPEGGGGPLRTLVANQLGVTLAQGLLEHLVVASTLKIVRGGTASGTTDGSTDPLDVADDLEIASETHADLDLGAMVAYRHVRVGLTVRNLRQPQFGDGDHRVTLKRQVRAGLAILAAPKGLLGGVIVSADGDLTRSATPFGDVRHAAVGGEVWLANRRFGVRGGLAANTIGERRPSSSTGASIAITRSLFIDGARTFGSDQSIRGWSSSVRVGF